MLCQHYTHNSSWFYGTNTEAAINGCYHSCRLVRVGMLVCFFLGKGNGNRDGQSLSLSLFFKQCWEFFFPSSRMTLSRLRCQTGKSSVASRPFEASTQHTRPATLAPLPRFPPTTHGCGFQAAEDFFFFNLFGSRWCSSSIKEYKCIISIRTERLSMLTRATATQLALWIITVDSQRLSSESRLLSNHLCSWSYIARHCMGSATVRNYNVNSIDLVQQTTTPCFPALYNRCFCTKITDVPSACRLLIGFRFLHWNNAPRMLLPWAGNFVVTINTPL